MPPLYTLPGRCGWSVALSMICLLLGSVLMAQELAYVAPPPASPVADFDVDRVPLRPTAADADLRFDPEQRANRLLNGHDLRFMAADREALADFTVLPTEPSRETPVLTLADRSYLGEFRENLGELRIDRERIDEPAYRSELDREVERRVRAAATDSAERLALAILADSEWLQARYETLRRHSRVAVNYPDEPDLRASLTDAPAAPTRSDEPAAEEDESSYSQQLKRLLGAGMGFELAPHVHGYYPGYRIRLRAPIMSDVQLWDASSLGIYADGQVRGSIGRDLPVGRVSLDGYADLTADSQQLRLTYGLRW